MTFGEDGGTRIFTSINIQLISFKKHIYENS